MSQQDLSLSINTASPAIARKLPSSRRPALSRLTIGAVVPLALFAAWRLATQYEWVAPQILPAPALVAQTFLEQVSSGELFDNLFISLGRVAGGFALGAAVGIALGVAMGLSRTFESYIGPLFRAVSQVPVLGWLPLAMMLLGIGEALKVVIIAHASLVPVAVNTLKGIRGVPRNYVDVAHAFRFSRLQLMRKVVFPAAVPSIFAGIRFGLTQAWLSLVTVELLASSEGLGFLIVWGRQLFQLDVVLAAIVVVGVVGLLLDKALALLEARLLRWRPDNTQLLSSGA